MVQISRFEMDELQKFIHFLLKGPQKSYIHNKYRIRFYVHLLYFLYTTYM